MVAFLDSAAEFKFLQIHIYVSVYILEEYTLRGLYFIFVVGLAFRWTSLILGAPLFNTIITK